MDPQTVINKNTDPKDVKLGIDPTVLQSHALGTRSYYPFQIRGFPCGFDYPESAKALQKVTTPEGTKANIMDSLAYALILAFCVSSTSSSGENVLLEFTEQQWSE